MRDDKSFFFFLQNLAYVYIASLQFYKQMYNKYIINKLLMWDSEEPAFVCSFFFFSSFFIFFFYDSMEDGEPRLLLLYEEYSYSSALRRPKSIQPK